MKYRVGETLLHESCQIILYLFIHAGPREANKTKPKSKNIDVHVFIVAPEKRLVAMMAAVNSVRRNTNASVLFHLLTDTQAAADHIALWLQKTELRDVASDIIVFNSSWVAGKYRVPSQDPRSRDFSHPVYNSAISICLIVFV